MYISTATITDAPVIHSLMISAFTKYKNDTPPSSALDETIESIEAALEAGEQALICHDEGKPAGMVRFTIEGEMLYFFRLSVLPEKQGRGIAKKLLDQLEQVATQRQMNEIQCKVRASLPQNIRLYESIGYEVFEEQLLDRGAGPKIPIVSMRKKLGYL